jgi:hypothetical protein
MGAVRAHRDLPAWVGRTEKRAGHMEPRPRAALLVELHAQRESREVLRDRRTGKSGGDGRARDRLCERPCEEWVNYGEGRLRVPRLGGASQLGRLGDDHNGAGRSVLGRLAGGRLLAVAGLVGAVCLRTGQARASNRNLSGAEGRPNSHWICWCRAVRQREWITW